MQPSTSNFEESEIRIEEVENSMETSQKSEESQKIQLRKSKIRKPKKLPLCCKSLYLITYV